MPVRKDYKPRAAKKDFVILLAPDFITSVGVGSVEYQVESDGSVEVPAQYAGELESHGLVRAATPGQT